MLPCLITKVCLESPSHQRRIAISKAYLGFVKATFTRCHAEVVACKHHVAPTGVFRLFTHPAALSPDGTVAVDDPGTQCHPCVRVAAEQLLLSCLLALQTAQAQSHSHMT